MGQLASKLAIHLSIASNLVRRLEDLGLVERVREAHDRRVVRLRATATGRRKLRRAPGPNAGVLQQALMALPQAELESLRIHLDALVKRMGPVDRNARATPLADILSPIHERKAEPRATPRRRR